MTGKCLVLYGAVWMLAAGSLAARNITTTQAGRVSLDFVNTEAQYRNTVLLVKARLLNGTEVASIGSSGCLTGRTNHRAPAVALVTNKLAAFGCRVTLDSNPQTANQIEGFPAGTTFELSLCVDRLSNGVCDDIWSSDPALNSDLADHLFQEPIRPERNPGILLRLGWEDSRDNGDKDFNDSVLYFRVERDSDGDGLWDDWEEFGIDSDGDGEIDYRLKDANPRRKDVYLEIDYMGKACKEMEIDDMGKVCDGHSHKPSAEAIAMVVAAFAKAPVSNPDGSTGITLHAEVSNEIPHIPVIQFGEDRIEFGKDFADLKNTHFDKPNARRFVYRYVIFAHRYDRADNDSGGLAETPGDDLLVTLTNVNDMGVAGTLMHELGHSLGLKHGGGDDLNDKPNYRSVMNYRFQYSGVPYWERPLRPERATPVREYGYRIDYSRLQLPTLQETALDENLSVYDAASSAREGTPGIPVIEFNCPPPPTGPRLAIVETAEPGGGHDWNCNGNFGDTGVQADLNKDREETELKGFNDWPNLTYAFQNDSLRFGAVYREPNLIEQSPQQAAEAAREIAYRPVAVIQPLAGTQLQREVTIDGSLSFIPGQGGALEYRWRVVGLPAALSNDRSPRTIAQFAGGPGEYRFELTVTAPSGLTHTASTMVIYGGR
jgi:hypothetical protein